MKQESSGKSALKGTFQLESISFKLSLLGRMTILLWHQLIVIKKERRYMGTNTFIAPSKIQRTLLLRRVWGANEVLSGQITLFALTFE